jgi:hypothetical protein
MVAAPNMGPSMAGIGQPGNTNAGMLSGHGNPAAPLSNPTPAIPPGMNTTQASATNNLNQGILWRGRICIVGGNGSRASPDMPVYISSPSPDALYVPFLLGL